MEGVKDKEWKQISDGMGVKTRDQGKVGWDRWRKEEGREEESKEVREGVKERENGELGGVRCEVKRREVIWVKESRRKDWWRIGVKKKQKVRKASKMGSFTRHTQMNGREDVKRESLGGDKWKQGSTGWSEEKRGEESTDRIQWDRCESTKNE